MGMSASQARYLGLTARKSDNEFQAQQVAQERATLAQEMDTVATNYSNKMSNTNLLFVTTNSSGTTSTKLTYDTITSTDPIYGLSMRVVDSTGRVVVPQAIDFDTLKQNALDTYNDAINNRAYSYNADPTVNNPVILTGANFVSQYYSTAGNTVYDNTGNAIDSATLQKSIASLDAPGLVSYFKEKGITFSSQANLTESLYTSDDSSAAVTYEKTIADLDSQRSGTSYAVDANCSDPEYLEKMLRSGKWSLEKVEDSASSTDYGEWTTYDWTSSSRISSSLDTSDDGAAEAEYTERSNFFAQKDKQLELKQHQLDTQHSAIQTELDSVKKVIEKNVESSFKTFA